MFMMIHPPQVNQFGNIRVCAHIHTHTTCVYTHVHMHVYAHVEKCSRVTQNLVQIRCSARSVTVHAGPHSTRAHSVASAAPLTSIGKLPVFTHTHSGPLASAARFHQGCTNRSRYINNGRTFSGQASYTHTHPHTHTH